MKKKKKEIEITSTGAGAYWALLIGDITIIIIWTFAKSVNFADAISAVACAQLFGYLLTKYLETRKKVGLLIVCSVALLLVIISLIMSIC